MKILEVNKFYYLRRGAERHLLDLIDALRRRGHEVEVFSMRHPENLPASFGRYFPSHVGYNASDSGILEKIVGIGRLFWSFEAKRGMERLLSEWRPDIVHIHNIYHQLSPSVLAPIKHRNIPIIMTVHDYHLVSPDKDAYYDAIGDRYWKFLFMEKYGFFKRLLLVLKMYWQGGYRMYDRYIDRYIVPSRFVKDVLVRAGMPERKITVLPHFIPDTEEVPVADIGDGDKPFALSMGALSQGKGTNDLVGLFDAIAVPLVLAGKQEDGFVLRKSPVVSAVGQKSKAELRALMQRSACVVSASHLPETFGLVALEAIACGKPFFGLGSGAYPEIIEDGKNGFLAESVDGLRGHLEDFFSGKSSFSSSEIAEDAEKRFGEKQYMDTLEKMCSLLTDATKGVE